MDDEYVRLINYKKLEKDFTPAVGIKIYYGDDIPLHLLELKPSPDTYEIMFENKEYDIRVYLNKTQRYVVVQDREVFEEIELMVLFSLIIASLLSIILSYSLSKFLSNKIIRPLTKLSDLVSSDTEQYIYPVESNDEVGNLTRAINEQNDRLNRYISREKLFTGDVSHELRTPLTIILGAAEVLQVKLKCEAEMLSYADRIRNTALTASQRVTALFLLSRKPESIDSPLTSLYEIIENEINNNSKLLKNKSVVFTLEGVNNVRVHARPELAGIVIGNLIRNAFQYTDSGQVIVRLSQDRLMIEDTGPGIPEDIRKILFKRYVHGQDTNHPGSGLGLSIVKRVCDHLGWDISYKHKDSGGSQFEIQFDL